MQINQNLSPFEAEVLQLLTELNVKMQDLTGTKDQPGRITILESKVGRLTIGFVVLALAGGGALLGPHAITLISYLLK